MNAPISSSANGQILQEYEKLVWTTADTLRGAGFKESDWPKFMMPFFALALVESRMLRARKQALAEFSNAHITLDMTKKSDCEEFREEYLKLAATAQGTSAGFHNDLVFHGQTLAHIVDGASPASFAATLQQYLAGFDDETRKLLGVNPAMGEAHYLDIRGVIGQMEGKGNKPLLPYARKWSEMDLSGFDSSEVTTLEEHLKRRWGDISAETSGEQYTPRDLIKLVSILIIRHFRKYPIANGIMDIYDPTCGGGNMLFGVADAVREATQNGSLLAYGQPYSINLFGQELNDQLYALAAVEAKTRPSATIREGNTLTHDQFPGRLFDAIVANPPYGVDWKNIKADIEADQSGRFDLGCMPPTSDGQMLFLQHIFSHLKEGGFGLTFCSGSTLFSGDAGGGESNARMKLIMNEDGVAGIVQLPKNEFFNTGINTYLWIFWKGKTAGMKEKLFLMNAEKCFTKLRKALGSKTVDIPDEHLEGIADQVDIITTAASHASLDKLTSGLTFPGAAQAQLMLTEAVHYNKVNLLVTRQDAEHGALTAPIKLDNIALEAVDSHGQERRIGHTGGTLEEVVAELDEKDLTTTTFLSYTKAVVASGATIRIRDLENQALRYTWNANDRIFRDTKGKALGRAALGVSGKWKAPKGSTNAQLRMDVIASPDQEKDTETVPYSRDPQVNASHISAFLDQWVQDPYVIQGEPTVGCEINFNRIFPKGSQVRSSADILAELDALDAQIAALKTEAK